MNRVLVCEDIGTSALTLLEEAGLATTLASDWSRPELLDEIGNYQALLVRSATDVDKEMLARAGALRVIGRAGVGVDNIDLQQATEQGVVVVNAPESNVTTAAEHTIGLLLALARNIPQAHHSLSSGQWQRSKFSGVELADKTLGIIGFGRIGQLVAARARGLEMKVIAFDPYIAEERFRELGVERVGDVSELYRQADFITIHLPKTAETENFLDKEAFAQMKDGVRILNVARGPLLVDEDLQAALDSGKVAGAALDVFRQEPITDHPLFAYDNVIVTPHLGASTEEATDRAGRQVAEQVVAILAGLPASHALNLPALSAKESEELRPFEPLARRLGYLAAALSREPERLQISYRGHLAGHDCRGLTNTILAGFLSRSSDAAINEVNAPLFASSRGIAVETTSDSQLADFTDLIRVTVVGGQETTVAGAVLAGQAHLVEVWQRKVRIALTEHLSIFRYRDLPGMIGRVGTVFGAAGINIDAAAIGADPGDGEAVMVLTTAEAVSDEIIAEIVADEDFFAGQTVDFPAQTQH